MIILIKKDEYDTFPYEIMDELYYKYGVSKVLLECTASLNDHAFVLVSKSDIVNHEEDYIFVHGLNDPSDKTYHVYGLKIPSNHFHKNSVVVLSNDIEADILSDFCEQNRALSEGENVYYYPFTFSSMSVEDAAKTIYKDYFDLSEE